jgi:cytochrome c2
MEQRTNSPYPRFDRPTLAVVGVLLILSCALFFASDRRHDWRYYQLQFQQQVAQKYGADKAAKIPGGVQQVWVAGLRRADRCVTCHQATAWKGFENAEEPYRTHPTEPLKGHPIEKFGCTACHGGQGWAVDTADAHGEVAHWEEPLLSRALGQDYSLATDKGALIQMNCNVCHRYDRETKGASAINLAKRLVEEKGCRACHTINNRGGHIGPDLTRVGEKAP